jgi:hypothetical protein
MSAFGESCAVTTNLVAIAQNLWLPQHSGIAFCKNRGARDVYCVQHIRAKGRRAPDETVPIHNKHDEETR